MQDLHQLLFRWNRLQRSGFPDGCGFSTVQTQLHHDVTGEVTSFSPHIILLDITLPFFNGYHWCSEIRKFSRVPIIFISSAADNMNIIMAMNLGADDFVAKPFDLNVLLAKIQALLRRMNLLI